MSIDNSIFWSSIVEYKYHVSHICHLKLPTSNSKKGKKVKLILIIYFNPTDPKHYHYNI